MKNKFYIILTAVLTISLTLTACEGPKGPIGPDGLEGPQGPERPPGEDGNANVKRIIVDRDGIGYDFTNITAFGIRLERPEDPLMFTWVVYLVEKDSDGGWDYTFYHISGYGKGNATQYRAIHNFSESNFMIQITKVSGPGEFYDEIHFIGIEISNREGNSLTTDLHTSPEDGIPTELDISDYRAVLKYYGITD